jgi:hypothetical protein
VTRTCAYLLDDLPDPAGKNSPLQPSFFPASIAPRNSLIAHAVVYSVSLRDAVYTPVESARTPHRVSSGLLIMELANLLCVKAAFAPLRKTLRRFALTRKFCQPFGKLPEDTQSDWQKGGESCMRTYEVRVLVPKLELIEAKDEAEALEKVGELYKELYAQELRDLVARLPEPEDFE